MRKAGLMFLFCCVIFLIATPAAMAAPADMFAYMPSDYLIIMHTPNFERVLRDGDTLARSLGSPLGKPEQIKELLEAMRQSGFNTASEASLVLFDLPDKQADPQLIVLAYIKDKSLLQKAVTSTADGSLVLSTANRQQIYIQYAGDYVIMTPDKDSLQRYRQSLHAGQAVIAPEVKAAIFANDATMIMNFKKVWPLANALLAAESATPAAARAVSGAARPELDPATKLWLDEIDTVLIGYKNAAADFSINCLMTFKPGGFAANVVNRYNATAMQTFAGLPSGKWLAAGLFTGERQISEAYQSLTGKDFQQARLSASKQLSPTLAELITQANRLNPLLNGGRFAWYAAATEPPAPAGTVLQGIYILETPDSAQLSAEIGRFVKAVVAANRRDKDSSVKIAEKAAAFALNDLSGKRIDLTFSAAGKSADGGKFIDMLQKINGSETVSLYLLPYDRQTLVLGIGKTEPLLRLATTAFKTGAGTLANDPQLSQTQQRLAGANINLIAISPGKIMDTAIGNGQAMFEMLLSQPVTFSAGAAGEVMTLQVSVPQSLIKMLFRIAAPQQKNPSAPAAKQPAG